MKNSSNWDIEKLLVSVGNFLREKQFVVREPVFTKIVLRLDNNSGPNNRFFSEPIFVSDIIRNIFVPVVVGAILLVLTFKFFGEKIFYTQVEFKLKNISAAQVEIVGDFTNWQPVKLKNRNGYWETKFYLKPGLYRYVYIIDKKIYFLEPGKEVLEDDFGNKNSVIVI
jgi:hypothetical protein